MLYELKNWCDMAGVEFLASCFDAEMVSWAEEVGMRRYKIASNCIYNKGVALAVHNTGKPVILSYGMVDEAIVPDIFKLATEDGVFNPDITKLYCVSKYPATLEDVEFVIKYRENSFNVFSYYDGFSDHTEGLSASIVAMSLGATMIEKHITLDKGMDGPDHKCSLTLGELAELCAYRDDIERLLYGKDETTTEEK